nr:type IV toxin-antitoxin system AbiEi family antitoxin domain-containing protein [Conexibacter arvalis]
MADRQHGVVSRRQLVDAGLTPTMIQTRLARGQLVPLHRGVYALGHRRLARFGFWTAAVLAAGPDAALSHRDAAALHGLLSLERARIDVTSPRRMASTARIDAHDRRALPADERTAIAGIPVTTVERTLVDLGEVVPAHRLRKALAEAERMRAADAHRLAAAMERTRGRRGGGHAALTAALAELRRHGPQRTRSEAEDLFLDLVIEHRLARPRMNMLVDGAEVDAVWPAQRVAVEVDGAAYHWTDDARERDRRKSNRLAAAGWRVLRFDWWEVSEPPRRAAVAAALRAAGIPHE